MLALIFASVNPSVPQTCEQRTGIHRQGVGKTVHWLWQPTTPTTKGFPRPAIAPAIDVGLGAAVALVRQPGGVTCGNIPAFGVVRIDGQAPGVMTVAAFVGCLPSDSAVAAPSGPAATRFVGATRNSRMPDKRVNILLRARRMIAPGLAAVFATHDAAQLDPCEQ